MVLWRTQQGEFHALALDIENMADPKTALSFPLDRRVWPLAVVLFLFGLFSVRFLHQPWLGAVFFALCAGHAAFFRDPWRRPEGEGFISPADGRITDITTVQESRYLKEEAVKIGIFLSILNAHVNRAPWGGTVRYREYVPGKFLNAMKSESSEYNESNWVGLDDGRQRVLVRQIAGLIARRIRCDVKTGDRLARGQKFGIICYGSRVEFFVPARNVRVTAKVGQNVKAGKTLLGECR